MSRLPPFAVVFGPTASGKSAIAKCLHERLSKLRPEFARNGIELISADSMQVYRGMDIGTAKPSLEEQSLFPHHLIDIREPNQAFTAGDFVQLAESAIREASWNGSLPLVVGGTAFYLRCLLCGMPETPPSDKRVRTEIEYELAKWGHQALRDELQRIDPTSAAKISLSDDYRLVRALEIYRISGRPRSSFQVSTNLSDRAGNALVLGLSWQRDKLYERINQRVNDMARAGLRSEVAGLLERGFAAGDPGLRAIGYREYLEADHCDTMPDGLPADATVLPIIRRNTRRLAKRQVTFFRVFERTKWISGENIEAAAESAIDLIRETYGG